MSKERITNTEIFHQRVVSRLKRLTNIIREPGLALDARN